MSSWLTGALAPTHRTNEPGSDIDVRYTSSRVRGWLRLITGMVRGNRPWQLVWGLASALAAALAAAGFGLFTSTVRLGDVLGPVRGATATVLSLALMIGWLIAAHGLWERLGTRTARDRRLAALQHLDRGDPCHRRGLPVSTGLRHRPDRRRERA